MLGAGKERRGLVIRQDTKKEIRTVHLLLAEADDHVMNSSTRLLSMKNARSKASSISASDPVTLAGSGVLQCSFLGLLGKRGHFACSLIANRDDQIERLCGTLIP